MPMQARLHSRIHDRFHVLCNVFCICVYRKRAGVCDALPPFGRQFACAIVNSHTFPSAETTVPVRSLACSAKATVENLSRCQKTECAENCPTGSLARIQQPISLVRSLTGRHPANPFWARAE